MKWTGGVFAAALLITPLMLSAGTESTASRDYDQVQILLEYNRRMVRMTENYLKDRPRIPADYQGVSDKEYLRRYRLEKPLKIPPKDLELPLPTEDEKPTAPKPHTNLKKK